MAENLEGGGDTESLKCPVCGCGKPKTWTEGRYKCVDCTCTVDSGCHGSVEDG